MQLSDRLQAVSDLVTEGLRLADVGTDHAYIPIRLAGQGRIPGAIAMDINPGPLARARENIRLYGLEERIETRLSDGVAALAPGEADSVVIAGMGGSLVIKILEEGKRVLDSVQELILQPQSDIDRVRKYLMENSYEITAENMILEDGKYYPMMHVAHGQMRLLSQTELRYGPCLLRDKNACLQKYIKREKKTLERVLAELREKNTERAALRMTEIEQELEYMREAEKLLHMEETDACGQ